MPRKFLWMTLPCYAAGAEPQGGGTPSPTEGGTGEAAKPTPPPAEPKAPEGGEPAKPAPTEGEVKGPGSLIEGDAPKSKEGEAPEAPPAFDMAKVKLPEGLAADDPGLKSVVDLLGDAKLSPEEKVSKLVEQHSGVLKDVAAKAAEAATKSYTDLNAKWVTEIKTDSDLGGEKFQATISTIAKGIDQWAPDAAAVRQALALTGAGNNPHVIRLLYSMSKALAEGGPAQGAVPHGKKSAADIFYGSPAAANGAA